MHDLKNKKQWVNYILFKDPDDPDNPKKPPKNPYNGYPARVNDPKTWGTYNQALSKVGQTLTHRKYDKEDKTKFEEFKCEVAGIGFVFSDNLVGIDIDKCVGNPALENEADGIIKHFNSYAELSPSGKGYHILIRCDLSKLPANYKDIYNMNPQRHNMECYVAGITKKYFTYTGEAINNLDIEERTPELIEFLDKYMLKDNFKAKNARQERTENKQTYQTSTDILEKARKAKNGAKFRKLFDNGDTNGYRSHSEADQALCNILAWWLQGDFDEIDRYFRQSKLYRGDKWEREDYKRNTINNAISKCNGEFYTEKEKAENIFIGEKLTIAAVKEHLKLIDVNVKYNETIRKTEIHGFNDYNDNYIVDSLPIIIYDQLNLLYKQCPKGDVQDFLKVIMMNNAYNPVLELIEGNKWDGVDRRPELYRILNIAEDDTLSKILIYKWHWQNLSMLRNDKGDFGADGTLVLQSERQGIGKTTYARKAALKNDWFGEGLELDVRDKDKVIQAVSCWIGELGEIENTFKHDINALKAFITKANDQYRVPYGRVAETLPRRTSFIGTCNSTEYLIDETGNRRYWTVPVDNIDLEALEKFDMLQLYLQIDEQDARNNIQGFRLTPAERELLDKRNSEHEKALKGETEIRDILYKAENDENSFVYEEMTVTEFKLLYNSLKNYSANQIGTALRKHGVQGERKKVDGKVCTIYKLPRLKNRIAPSDFTPNL